MPNLAGWNDVKAQEPSTGDGFKRLPAGAYVACLGAMEPVHARSGNTYYRIPFDIFEGEFAGYYDDDFGRIHPGLHSINLFVSSQRAMEISKGVLSTVTACNPAFDADAAFVGDNFDAFRGKLVGVVLGDEEYEDKAGDVKTSPKYRRVATLDQVRAGGIKVPDVKLMDGSYVPVDKYQAPKSASTPSAPQTGPTPPKAGPVDYSDIPF